MAPENLHKSLKNGEGKKKGFSEVGKESRNEVTTRKGLW